MTRDFKDLFSGHSKDYGQYRPDYPDEMFLHLSYLTPRHELAWDCATGTGQAALQLTKYYRQINATDASANQISQAVQHKQIHYFVVPAEDSGLDDNSVDLITVAQALHWFDIDSFAEEAGRVMTRNGILAAWTYDLLKITPAIDEIVNHLYTDMLENYWPPERRLIENEYRDIHLPFNEIEAPRFLMETHWNLHQLIGYLNTWSAVKRFESDRQNNPVSMIAGDLEKAWSNPQKLLDMNWPFTLRIWQK